LIKLYSFITILFLSTNIYATNIAVIDINFLINNSIHFKDISKKINSAQIKIKEKFNNTEQDLLKIKLELEESKIILSNDEFNFKKEEYYKKVSKFEDDVTKFNNHYENEIIKIKNIIFTKISDLVQDHASLNGIELIIEKNQYLIAADKININQVIFEKLNASKIDLQFTKYEN
tara:strand:+ start:6675 stop:7199 length:525 start_codon:yes stop_codon:yes gene_type:complete